MVQTIAAEKITLYDLEQQFSLQQTDDASFFREWQEGLPTLTEDEQQRLKRVQEIVANLKRRSVLESTQQFVLGQDHDLERVLQILKRLAAVVAQVGDR